MAVEYLSRLAQSAVANVLSVQGAPSHVAFIMDGNRRFAEARGRAVVEGHTQGYGSLIKALEWCLDLGVRTVSVYAFSVENYCRSRPEVEGLMALAEAKLRHMLERRELLIERGVRVRVVGDLRLAPRGVREAARDVELATRHHSRLELIICFSYSSSGEMLEALDAAETSGAGGEGPDEACEERSAAQHPCFPASSSETGWVRGLQAPPVDLLIRTSGETRLSDFLLWQSRFSLLHFTPTLWPDFSFWDFASAVVAWQGARGELARARARAVWRPLGARWPGPARARAEVDEEEARSLGAESEDLHSADTSLADSGSEADEHLAEVVQAAARRQAWAPALRQRA